MYEKILKNQIQNRDDTNRIKNDLIDALFLPPCDEDLLVSYLAQLQAVNPESIVLCVSEDIEQVCTKVEALLTLIEDYIRQCDLPNNKDLYTQLIKGVDALFNKLCMDSGFKKAILRHWPCIHEIQDSFQGCSGPPDWQESSEETLVCR